MLFFLQQTLNSLQLGSVYALIALGYTMVYGVLRLINFAHGDIFMVGAFLALYAATGLGLPFLGVLLVAMAGTAALGVVVERVAYRPLRGAPRVSAVITALGVGIFLENVMLATVGAEPRRLPPLVDRAVYHLGPLTLTSTHLLVLATALGLMLLLDLFLNRSLAGMAMRAAAWDREALLLMGVPVDRIVALTFALGSALAAAGGLLYGMAYPILDPYMGILIGWKAFVAAVVGGIGNVRGAMLGGYLLGFLEIFVAAYLPSTARDLVAFTLLLALLVFRPSGLFGAPHLVQKA